MKVFFFRKKKLSQNIMTNELKQIKIKSNVSLKWLFVFLSHSKLSWFLEVLTNIGSEINVLFKIAAFCAHNWSTSIKIVSDQFGDEC